MKYTLKQKSFLSSIDDVCYEEVHSTGLTIIYLMNQNAKDVTLNISFRTPAINHKGISHVLEHCIASNIQNPRLIMQRLIKIKHHINM